MSLPDADHNLGPAMLSLEAAEDRREHVTSNGNAGADDDAAALRVHQSIDQLFGHLLGAQDLTCPIMDRSSGFSGKGSPVASLEQLHAEVALHSLHLHADRWLRHDELIGRRAEALALHYPAEHFEVAQVHDFSLMP